MSVWLLTASIILPAIWLAGLGSSWLLDYAIFIMAFNRGLRRIIDYFITGHFDPYSPITLTPLVVAVLLLVPGIRNFARISLRARRVFWMLAITLLLGLLVGFLRNRLAAIYSLAEWMSGLATMAFAATASGNRGVADRWVKSAGWAAVGVAAYGWWQYYTIPPWDGMWLVQSGMVGYLGKPEPTMMTVFSTLNERGPCGAFLAWGVIPMIIDRRWRNVGGWASIALLLSGIALTGTRSNLIIVGLVALLYPAFSKGKGLGRLLLLAGVIVAGTTWGMGRVPGLMEMKSRFEGESLYGQGSSFQGRLENYKYGLAQVIANPLGLGLGSSGMGFRAGDDSIQSLGDSGYIQIFAQFGLVGGLLFFAALWVLWRELTLRWVVGCRDLGVKSVDPFLPATRSILLGSLVFLFVGDIFGGFSLIWVFFGRALGRWADSSFLTRAIRLSRQSLPDLQTLKDTARSNGDSSS